MILPSAQALRGRFAHTAHAIWATAAVYLLVCGLLVAQRYQFALTEDAFRQQQQLASQNVLVSVFEANKAAIVIGRIQALEHDARTLEAVRASVTSLRRELRAHTALAATHERAHILELAGLSRLVSPEGASDLLARIERGASQIDGQLDDLEHAESSAQLKERLAPLRLSTQTMLDELRTFGDFMNQLSSEVLVAARKQIQVAADASRYIDYTVTALLVSGLVLAAGFLRAILKRQSALNDSYRNLARSRDVQASILEAAFNPIVAIDSSGHVFEWNPAAESTFGFERAKVLGRRLSETIIPERYRAAHEKGLKRFLATSESSVLGTTIEISALRADGTELPVELAIATTELEGQPIFVAHLADITPRIRADAALRLRESQLQAVMDYAPLSIALRDIECRYLLVNRTWRRWYDTEGQDVVGKTAHDFFPGQPAAQVTALIQRTIDTGTIAEEAFENVLADGTMMNTRFYSCPVTGPNGEITGVVTFELDVTRHKQLEEQLRQSQRIEAIGQLTGGVAHDFNNLLAVIIGNLELAEDAAEDARLKDLIAIAIKAADRGAALTSQLLAFGRRQALQPRPTDLNQLTSGMEAMLRRTLGESIVIETRLAEDLHPALVDPRHLETALLNLALNARDAMPDGGHLTIETMKSRLDESEHEAASEAGGGAPGPYVTVAVGDSGCGMSPEVAARAIEPFFTTKDVGKGTGLGLAMVHGFVSQSGGFMRIQSAAGLGTTVTLYLPSSCAEADATAVSAARSQPGNESACVLLVEDEPAVRQLVADQLQGLGYAVQEAADGTTALARLKSSSPIDLLLTDVMLPGALRGPALAERAKVLRPGLAVVYMSSYPEAALMDNVALPADVVLLNKPFRIGTLQEKLNEALGRAQLYS